MLGIASCSGTEVYLKEKLIFWYMNRERYSRQRENPRKGRHVGKSKIYLNNPWNAGMDGYSIYSIHGGKKG